MDLAVEQGATLLKGRVEGLRKTDAGAVTGVMLDDGRELEADVVVLCMGPWSGRAQSWIPTLPKIDGSKAHSIVVQPALPGAFTDHAVFISYAAKMAKMGKMQNPEIYPRPGHQPAVLLRHYLLAS